jgi:hypothetical protein
MNEMILTPWLKAGLAVVWGAKIAIFVVLSAYLIAFVPTIFERYLKHLKQDLSTVSNSQPCATR